MPKTKPKKCDNCELSLRDYLAAHRTALANNRTWMGNVRTSLALFVAGISFIKFFESEILGIIGLIFVPLALFNAITGYIRYRKRKRIIHSIPKNNDIEEHFDE
ncbi:DUF202 domain-containing protein [Candidatus Peregrinibacteria bacterium]|nr:DUF202 domain-containing protein [Candidatus Peregrinibacteria bacterium]